MARTVTVAAVQANYGREMEANIAKTEKLVRQAARKGAQIVLPSELFQNIYFCGTKTKRWFKEAYPTNIHPCIIALQSLAKELNIVLPISYFERDGTSYYNSIAIIDADGTNLGTYRKSHIPTGPGYEEQFYFKPGNTGYKVWKTKYARIGVGICWDQWFPETSRAFVRNGAEILFYPTAIGNEPSDPTADTLREWTKVQQGQAIANHVPWIASNRVGTENALDGTRTYYGSSFICDHTGTMIRRMNRTREGVIIAKINLDESEAYRKLWDMPQFLRPFDMPPRVAKSTPVRRKTTAVIPMRKRTAQPR